MKKLLKNKKGFTLVELMVVVAIMAILVAVAIPVYNNVTEKAAVQVDESNARVLTSAISQIKIMNGGKLETAKGTPVAENAALESTTTFYDGNAVIELGKFVAEWPVLQAKANVDGSFVWNEKTQKVTIVPKAGS